MFAEDLSVFFQTDEHAIEAKVGSTPVPVIFDAPNVDAFSIAGVKPSALIQWTDAATAAVGATITIKIRGVDTDYIIRDQSPEDDGAIVRLQLEQQ
jgi:hypothetical protein